MTVKENNTSAVRVITERRGVFYLSMLIIVCLSFAAYFNSLFNGFVHDDTHQILQNPWIKDLTYLPEIFSTHVWDFVELEGMSNYYRPLMHTIYLISYHIFGLKPWGFHLVNILLHAGVSVLVFLVLTELMKKTQPKRLFSPPFVAAILFATHPIHTEAVTWLAGLPDPSFSFFYLLSFYLYIRATVDGRISKSLYLSSVLCFFLAMLCKEPALTLLMILVGYDYAFHKDTFSASPLKYAKRYLPYLLVAGLYFFIRTHAVGGFAPLKRHEDLNTYLYIINVFPLFIQYLGKLILPVNLNAYHIFHPVTTILEPKSIASLILTAAFIGCVWLALKKNEQVFLALLFITVPLLPALYIPALGDNSFAERYLYLPSFGFAFLLSLLFGTLRLTKLAQRKTLLVGLFVLVGLYSLTTIKRNFIWRNNLTLWTDTVRKSPDGALPHSELGIAYADRGLFDEAIKHFQTAVRLEPDNPDYLTNLGFAYTKKGQIDNGAELFRAALKLNAHHTNAYYNLGLTYGNKGLIDTSIQYYQIVLKLNPKHTKAHNNLGIAYARKGMARKAIEHFQAALRVKPDDPVSHHNLANAYQMVGQVDKAKEHRSTALSLQQR
jgi:tetratricopeptide (TPR) repeat protein